MQTFDTFPTFYATHKKIKQRKSFGFYYLKPFTNATFKQLIEQYDNCVYLSINTTRSKWANLKQQLAEAADFMRTTGQLAQLKHVKQQTEARMAAINSFKWYQGWQKQLFDADFWTQIKLAANETFQEKALDVEQEKLKASVIKQMQLKIDTLEKSWQLHGKFSHYTSFALVCAADRLAVIESFLQGACEEFSYRSQKLPGVLHTGYQSFLLNSLKKVQAEKDALAAAMRARLQVMRETQNLVGDDVTVHLLKDLMVMGALDAKTDLHLKRLPVPFDPKTFEKMHAYIAKVSGASYLHRLFHLQQADQTIPLIGKQCGARYLFLPATLSRFVPERPSKAGFLFKGHQFRFDFFQDKTALLLKLSFLPNFKIKTNCTRVLSKDAAWQHLKATEQMVAEALQSAEKQKAKGLLAPLYRQSNQLLTQWQRLLQGQQKNIVQQQLIFLEKWSGIPPLEHQLHQTRFSPEIVKEVTDALEMIEVKIGNTQFVDAQIYGRLANVKRRINDLFSAEQDYAQWPSIAIEVLQRLSSGVAVAEGQLNVAVEYCNNLKNASRLAFLQQHATAINTARYFMARILSMPICNLVASSAYESDAEIAEQCGKLLRSLKNDTIQQDLTRCLDAAIINYGNTLAQNEGQLEQESVEQLKRYVQLLEKLATPEQFNKLMAITLRYRNTLYSAEISEAASAMASDDSFNDFPNVAEESRFFLTEMRAVMAARRKQHEAIMQVHQQNVAAASTDEANIKEVLQRCEASQQRCGQLFTDNESLLKAMKALEKKPPAAAGIPKAAKVEDEQEDHLSAITTGSRRASL